MKTYTPAELHALCRSILFLSQDTLVDLGEQGKTEVKDARVYDISTKGDRSIAGKVRTLLNESGMPATFCDEELGVESLVQDPCYTVVFDDIDGTNNYARGKGTLPYCTAIAIFDKPLKDCTFKDVAAAAILEHRSGLLIEALHGEGCFESVRQPGDATARAIGKARTSGKETIVKRDTVVAIEGYETGRQIGRFAEIYDHAWVKDVSSSAHELMGVACGIYDGFIHPRHKKDEIAAGYLLVKEAGGFVTDFEGRQLDDKKFVYDSNARYDIVAAASPKLGTQLRVMIKPAQ